MLKCAFVISSVTDDAVFIIDTANETGRMTVTNDAEEVVMYLYRCFGNKRIFYKDTLDDWDELVHHHGKFKDFKSGIDLIREMEEIRLRNSRD